MPATDSASCAVTIAIRVRTSAAAMCESRWNQRVTRMPGREHAHRDEAEPPVEQEEAGDGGDQRQRVDDERRQALVEDVRERVDVARQPRDDPAGLLLREVAERQRGQVVEEVAAQLEHDALADAGEAEPGGGAENPGGRVHGDVGERRRSRGAARRRRGCRCRSRPDEMPARDRRRGGEPREHRDQDQAALLVLRVRREPRKPGAVLGLTRQGARLRRGRRRGRRLRAAPAACPARRSGPRRARPRRSATPIVESRWVATSTVRPATAGRRFSTSRRSVSVSTADIGSSSTRTREPASSARASATRWRWPPERLTPRSPISVS